MINNQTNAYSVHTRDMEMVGYARIYVVLLITGLRLQLSYTCTRAGYFIVAVASMRYTHSREIL